MFSAASSAASRSGSDSAASSAADSSRPAAASTSTRSRAGRALSAAELAALSLADRDAAEEAVLDTGLVCRVEGGLRFRHALLAEAVRADRGEQGRRYEQLALAIETASA